ncbi:MAG: hypothetical protein JWL98_2166 [Xanthomonadaceae bacterium]|nr:hypothetical protein [Xanthomonadaceae bacterium]
MAGAPGLTLRQRLDAWTRPRQPESLPVYFDRRRVYILPTLFGLFFSALLLVMWVGALNYNNNPALLLCLLLAGAANTSLLAAHLQLTGLQIVAAAADPVPAGSMLEMRLHVRAKPGRQRRGLRVHAGAGPAVLSLVDGNGQAVLALPTHKRGWLEPGRMRIETTRPLGLARAWANVWPDAPVLVYPMPEAHGPPLPEEGSGAIARARLHASGDDLHHLRPYRRGDARRAIAWKPSARRDALLVREFEQPLGADVVLDWNLLSMEYEARIRRLARWVDDAEREGRRSILRLPGQQALGPASGAAHRHACLRALALLPASDASV